MKILTTANLFYVFFCIAASGYFCVAAVEGWPNPMAQFHFDANSFLFDSDDDGTYSGAHSGRSSGGSWGGGK